MIEVNRDGEVWVFAEQQGGELNEVVLEILGRGRELADKLSVPLGAVLPGHGVRGLADTLGRYGADKVYLSEDPLLESYQSSSYAKVICNLIAQYKPQIMLYGASHLGRDLAPRVASAMKAGLTADCTDLQIGDHEIKRTAEYHKNLLLQIRPAFGGNIIATIVNYDRWPQMATVREGVMPLPTELNGTAPEIITATVSLSEEDLPLKILHRHTARRKVNLKASRIIVAGGAGLGSKDNFELIWDLANVLGGAPAGSRAAVDLGFIGHDYQIGQTGTTVRPALYIAVGISGAVQHVAGMSESARIVAINNDADAPIFQIAHYRIVGDLFDVVPEMIKAIRSKS